jgi:hypothetical protein
LKEKITTAIAEKVVKDYLPLSFVEGDGFLNLMNYISCRSDHFSEQEQN